MKTVRPDTDGGEQGADEEERLSHALTPISG
jgi:hypothetical protein